MKYHFVVTLALLFSTVLLTTHARGQFINYEHDPELAAAFRYDSEMNGGDRNLADQSQAELHYLRYLETAKDSAQRACAYVQLGVLYATNWHREKGEKPDYAKSKQYMVKALAEEPIRVGDATFRARGLRNTPTMSKEERLAQRIENFKWLSGLDEKMIKQNWLPIVPGQPDLDKRWQKAFLDLIENVKSAETHNMLRDACSFRETKDRIDALSRLVKTFPNTEVAKQAQARLDALAEAK